MLFERLGRSVRLTPEGERLLPVANRMLQAADEASRIAQKPGEVSGTLRIGVSDSLLMGVLAPVLSELSHTYPRVCASTHQQMPDEQFAMLRRNDIDVLLLLDERMERPEWVKVFEVPAEVGFVVAATDPMARRARVPLEEVLSRPLFLTERDVSYRAGLDERIWARGLEATPRVECGNTAFLAELVEGCGGVSFLPSCAVRAAVAAGRLAHVDVDFERLDLWHQAIVRKNKVVTPQMRLFLELVQRELCG